MRVLTRKSNLRLLIRRPAAFVGAYRWGLLILLAGATWDAYTTIQFVTNHGAQEELHPVARLFFQIFLHFLPYPVLAVAVGKIVQVLFVMFVSAIWRGWCNAILVACGILYLLAGCSNHFGWMVHFYRLFPGLLYD